MISTRERTIVYIEQHLHHKLRAAEKYIKALGKPTSKRSRHHDLPADTTHRPDHHLGLEKDPKTQQFSTKPTKVAFLGLILLHFATRFQKTQFILCCNEICGKVRIHFWLLDQSGTICGFDRV